MNDSAKEIIQNKLMALEKSKFRSGFHLKEKDIKIGDIVSIRKAGDVIPEVVEAKVERRTGQEKDFVMITECPMCKTTLIKKMAQMYLAEGKKVLVTTTTHMFIEKDKCDVPGIEYADMIYASHDFPVKDKESSDNLGSVLAYKVGSIIYIIDALEKKMAFKAGVQYVKQLDTHYLGSIQIIEDKANGSPILQQLQDEVPGLQAYNPGTASKMQRAESATLYMGNVVWVKSRFDKFTNTYHLPDSLQKLKKRLLDFPFVKYDDIVDAFTMLLLFVFMDRRFMVYGKSFNYNNIVDIKEMKNLNYSTIFFNKEGDIWKALEIAVLYGVTTKLVVKMRNKISYLNLPFQDISYL